jgi:glycosyltransferase involved in cell wall biosynthesis
VSEAKSSLATSPEVLPKVLYVGDVPVEASYHGSALLHRLLEKYATAHLTIIETGSQSVPARRLSNVKYLWKPIASRRWLNTRFHPYVVGFYSAAANRLSRKILSRFADIEFDSVLTVAHGFGWLAAAALAESRNVPLNLIVHDDWPRVAEVPEALRGWLDQRFGEVYRQSHSRLCVSPAMCDAYHKRYGEAAQVLYPMRNRKCSEFDRPPLRLSRKDHQFTVAFAGTINSVGYVKALKQLSAALELVNGRLLICGPLNQSDTQALKLDLPNVVLRGLLDWPDLIATLRDEADVLFAPMSFSEADRLNMELAFPSKLADYTAVGLPLLIYGPEYCSVVRWARDNQGVADVVTTESKDDLTEVISRLRSSPDHRLTLANRALEVGRKYFSYDVIQHLFDRALMPAVVQTSMPSVAASCSIR